MLGVTYDRGVTFGPHTTRVNAKAKPRLNVLRALTNTTFGHSKEDITQVYKQFIRPILTYAHPAWHPDIAVSHVRKLQIMENSALRIATGCTQTTPIHHLQHETQVLPLDQHLRMRGTHIYSSTADPSHPLLHLRTAPARRPRAYPPHTTPAKFYQDLHDSLPPLPEGITLGTHIHTTFTQRAIATFPPNSLLGVPPPLVNRERERSLPREDRVHLARLRCGHHTSIPTYTNRIGLPTDSSCVYCQDAEGTVEHILLHCPELQLLRDNHTIQSLEHLWERPEEALAIFSDAALI